MNKDIQHNLKIRKFIDPMSDFGFKRLFGSKSNKELLINFLNELFNGRKIITDLNYNKNEHPGSQVKDKKAIFDLTCTGSDGEQFIIEVQRIRQEYFKDRAVFYTSRLIQEQVSQSSTWDYSLKEVFFIGLMDFVFPDSDKNKHLHYIRLTYENGRVFYKKLEFIFIEIPKFVKTLQELDTEMDKWVYTFKNLNSLNAIPEALNNGIFKKLFNMAKVTNLSKEEYRRYQDDMMALWDEYAIKKTLLKEGREEGMEEGIEKGIEKGKREIRTQVVKNLLSAKKFTIEEIANFASVSESFVRRVKKEMKK